MVPVCRLPVEKDDTDTQAAVKAALDQGCKTIYIYGGTGGKRLDHTLANLQTIFYIRRQGARGYLYGDDFLWTVIENESLELKREVDWGFVSVFPLGEQAEGVTEEGLQYRLENGLLRADTPLGVSNHFDAPTARISVKKGALAVGWELSPLNM